MSHQLYLIVAIVAVVLLIYYWPKKKSTSAPAPAPPTMATEGPLPAWASKVEARGPMMATYRSSGYMMPNTYTFTTAGPKFGATMGSVPDNLQAVQAAVTNFTGTFIPNGQRNPSC